MRANTHVSLVVDNTAPQTQRSKCATPPQSFLTDQHPIYGGKAEVVRTQQSGGYWHFRMWISEERKYVRKTLKTTHLDTAVERAENEFFAIKANVNAGRRIFSPTVQQAEDEYLAHRWNVDVKRGSITEGRWATIKSHLNHFVAYCGIVGRKAHSSVTRLNDLESKSLQGYQQYRQQKVSVGTIIDGRSFRIYDGATSSIFCRCVKPRSWPLSCPQADSLPAAYPLRSDVPSPISHNGRSSSNRS